MGKARVPLKHSQQDVYSGQSPVCGSELCATPALTIPPLASCGPTDGFLPTLALLLAARLSPGQGFLSVQAGASAWQRRLRLLWVGAIFTDLSVSVISGARIGRGGEWECQALVVVPVGAEGQEAGWLCKVAGCRVTWACHSPSRAWSLGSEIKVTIRFSAPTPSRQRKSSQMVSV